MKLELPCGPSINMQAVANSSTPDCARASKSVNQTTFFCYTATWVQYERLKREWIATHPDATPEQYERAIADICKRLGV